MVVFDASILLFIFDENTPSSVPRAKERVEYLIDQLSAAGEKIAIPTPVLSECLVHAGPAGPDYLAILNKQSCFRIVSFDERAAIEAAISGSANDLRKAMLLYPAIGEWEPSADLLNALRWK